MSAETYELLALAGRYWFAVLAVVIVYRAWRCAVQDNRRAKVLRDWTPETGCVGELIVISGGDRARKGTRLPVPREGLVGSGRQADVRLSHRSVRKKHARLEEREGGLLLSAVGAASLCREDGERVQRLFLRDGERCYLGRVLVTLVLYDAPVAEEAEEPVQEDEFWGDIDVEKR